MRPPDDLRAFSGVLTDYRFAGGNRVSSVATSRRSVIVQSGRLGCHVARCRNHARGEADVYPLAPLGSTGDVAGFVLIESATRVISSMGQ